MSPTRPPKQKSPALTCHRVLAGNPAKPYRF
jgi:hypothetical protein